MASTYHRNSDSDSDSDSTPQPRDRTRRCEAKACALSRKADRRAKSARLFLAFAFPAELEAFTRH